MFHFFVMLGTGMVVVEAVMLLFWIHYCFRRQTGIIDIGWSFGFIAATIVYSLMGMGFVWRKILILTIVAMWAIRLIRHHSHTLESPHHELFLSKWPFAGFPLFQALTLFGFQGLLITVLSLPFALMTQNLLPFFSPYEVFGLLIWMIGLVGESIANWQLLHFRQNKQLYDQGLWKYSRHPNYFFEWIVWLGYGIMSLSSPLGWLGLISPLLVLFLLVKVYGIPLTEEQALNSMGEAYRDYQNRTSPFFPWFSKKTK